MTAQALKRYVKIGDEAVAILFAATGILADTSSEDKKAMKAAMRLCGTTSWLTGKINKQLGDFVKTSDPMHFTTAESFLAKMKQVFQAATTVEPPPQGQKATPRRKTKIEKK